METDINRLKVVLAEKKRTNKWLCEQLNMGGKTKRAMLNEPDCVRSANGSVG